MTHEQYCAIEIKRLDAKINALKSEFGWNNNTTMRRVVKMHTAERDALILHLKCLAADKKIDADREDKMVNPK